MTTLIPCPSWCTTSHDGGPEFHAADVTGTPASVVVRVWCGDAPDAEPAVVVGGTTLDAAGARALALRLLEATDALEGPQL